MKCQLYITIFISNNLFGAMEKVFNEKTTVLKKSTPKDSDKGGFQFGVNYSTG